MDVPARNGITSARKPRTCRPPLGYLVGDAEDPEDWYKFPVAMGGEINIETAGLSALSAAFGVSVAQ